MGQPTDGISVAAVSLGRAPIFTPRIRLSTAASRRAEPSWHNAPVGSFGPGNARLLIVGLAPGLKGANRTGRPFTGDYAGDLLYATLLKFGLATGTYETLNGYLINITPSWLIDRL